MRSFQNKLFFFLNKRHVLHQTHINYNLLYLAVHDLFWMGPKVGHQLGTTAWDFISPQRGNSLFCLVHAHNAKGLRTLLCTQTVHARAISEVELSESLTCSGEVHSGVLHKGTSVELRKYKTTSHAASPLSGFWICTCSTPRQLHMWWKIHLKQI